MRQHRMLLAAAAIAMLTAPAQAGPEFRETDSERRDRLARAQADPATPASATVSRQVRRRLERKGRA